MIYSETESHRLFNQDFEEFFEYAQDSQKVTQDILRIDAELEKKMKFWKGGSKKLHKNFCIVTDYCWDPVAKRIEGFPNRFHLSYPIERKSSKFIIRLAESPNFKYNAMTIEDVFRTYHLGTLNPDNQFIYLFEKPNNTRLISLNDVYDESFAKNVFQPTVLRLANFMNVHSVASNRISFFDLFINNYFTFDEYLEYSNKSLNEAVSDMLSKPNDGFIIQTASQLNRDNLRTLVKLMQNKDKSLTKKNESVIANFLYTVMFSKYSKSHRAYSGEQLRWLRRQINQHM